MLSCGTHLGRSEPGNIELAELVLIRWNTKKPWSPWNCVLLNDEEGRAHLTLSDIEKVRSCKCEKQV